MKKYTLVIVFIGCFFTTYSQSKTKVIKTDIGGIAQTNFFQISYESKSKENSSFEVGLGFGSKENINFYGVSTQIRFFLESDTLNTPFGFHFGPRVLAIYGETKESTFTGTKDSTFGFELDAISGYQFIFNDVLTIDPYIGYGMAIVENKTDTDFVWGITLGVAF